MYIHPFILPSSNSPKSPYSFFFLHVAAFENLRQRGNFAVAKILSVAEALEATVVTGPGNFYSESFL